MFPSLFQNKKKIKKGQLWLKTKPANLKNIDWIGSRANHLTNNYCKLQAIRFNSSLQIIDSKLQKPPTETKTYVLVSTGYPYNSFANPSAATKKRKNSVTRG